jgi:hypothetical protein
MLTPEELTVRCPLWHDFGPFTYDAMPGKVINGYLEKQRSSDLERVAGMVRKAAALSDPHADSYESDLVASLNRVLALADTLEQASRMEMS